MRLQDQLHSLLEALRLEKHRLYGARSEKAPGQAELFDEPEVAASPARSRDRGPGPDRGVSRGERRRGPRGHG